MRVLKSVFLDVCEGREVGPGDGSAAPGVLQTERALRQRGRDVTLSAHHHSDGTLPPEREHRGSSECAQR